MQFKSASKLIVYTCITGGYDNLSSPSIASPGVRYLCFADNPISAPPPWEVIVIDSLPLDAKDSNRYIKMHPHLFLPDHDVSLYVDGSIKILGDVIRFIEDNLQSSESIFFYEHPKRDCIYSEAMACAYYGHEWIWNIKRQMRRYQQEGFPARQGLFEAGVILRRNTAEIAELMRLWWIEYQTGVKRDQLSLTVVAWRRGTALGTLGRSDFRFEHRYFKFVPHPGRTPIHFFLRQRVNRVVAKFFAGVLTDARAGKSDR